MGISLIGERLDVYCTGVYYHLMLPEIPEEQVRAAVEGVALELLAEGDVFSPPVDMAVLAERLGIVIARDGASETRARFVRIGGASAGQATIYLADDPRPERRQWAIAHEIGESQAYRVFADLGVDAA